MTVPLSTWKYSSQTLLSYSVSPEKSTDNLMRTPLYVTSHFCLSAFRIVSLSLANGNLCESLWIYPGWNLLSFFCMLTQISEVCGHYFSKWTSFLSISFSLLSLKLVIGIMHTLVCFLMSIGSFYILHFFFLLFLSLDDFKWSVFRSDFFFCLIKFDFK